MATERQAPDGIVTQTSLSGAISALQDDPDSPDGNWWTAPGNNNDTEAHVTFPTPSGGPTIGAGLQEFRVLVRKTNHSTDPSCTIEVYENGSLVTALVSGQAVSSTSGTVLSGTWNASSLGTADGSLVECRVTGVTGGGKPADRASLEVGAIEWNVDYTVDTTDELFAADIQATSEVSSPAVGQAHALGALSIQAVSEVTQPSFGQVHALSANDIASASEITAPAIAIVTPLLAVDLEASSELTQPALSQVHALTLVGIESASSVSVPTLSVPAQPQSWQPNSIYRADRTAVLPVVRET